MIYPYVIDRRAFETILACAPRERRLLLDAFSRLTEAPFQESDMKDRMGEREVLIRIIGQFTVVYWLDHAVKEIRIVNVFRD